MAQKLNRTTPGVQVALQTFHTPKYGTVNAGNTVEDGHPMLKGKGMAALFAPLVPTFPAPAEAAPKPAASKPAAKKAPTKATAARKAAKTAAVPAPAPDPAPGTAPDAGDGAATAQDGEGAAQ